jgi:hypothetical protein
MGRARRTAMKKAFFTAVILGLAAGPALAGDGGSMDGTGALLIQAIGRLVGKIAGMF